MSAYIIISRDGIEITGPYAKVFDVFQIEKLFTYIFDVPISGVYAIVALRVDFQITYQLEKCYITL